MPPVPGSPAAAAAQHKDEHAAASVQNTAAADNKPLPEHALPTALHKIVVPAGRGAAMPELKCGDET